MLLCLLLPHLGKDALVSSFPTIVASVNQYVTDNNVTWAYHRAMFWKAGVEGGLRFPAGSVQARIFFAATPARKLKLSKACDLIAALENPSKSFPKQMQCA